MPRSLRSELETEPETAYCAVDAWAPVFGADAPQIRLVIGGSEGILRLTGTASTVYQSSADASAGRYAVFGIGKNLSAVSPYSGNTSSAINAWTTGAALQMPELVSHETGLSSWTLCVNANYPFELNAKDSATGAGPALIGSLEA